MTDQQQPAPAAGTATGQREKKPRLFYLDLVRALAAILIVITHFNNPYLSNRPIFANQPFGIYIGSLGVSLFLIISGAALMYTYGDEPKLDLKRFYHRRFLGIYPMFWLAFIIANAWLFLRAGGHVLSQAQPWTIVFSMLGVDGLVANTALPTFYTLGEWFLGFILLFYVVFPLLRYGVRNHPWITAVIVAALYVLTLVFQPRVFGLPIDLLLTTRLPELVFGMFFIRYIKRVPWMAAIVAIVFLAAQEIHPLLTGSLGVTFVGIAAFLVLVWAAHWLDVRAVRVPVKTVAKYSYPIFLVHHVLIMQIFTVVNPAGLSTTGAYLLFAVDFIIIMALSIALYRLERTTITYVRSMIAKA